MPRRAANWSTWAGHVHGLTGYEHLSGGWIDGLAPRFNGLSARAQQLLIADPLSGHLLLPYSRIRG
jgi:hypothetical protein